MYMIGSGEYIPAPQWVEPVGGRGGCTAQLESIWHVVLFPEQVTMHFLGQHYEINQSFVNVPAADISTYAQQKRDELYSDSRPASTTFADDSHIDIPIIHYAFRNNGSFPVRHSMYGRPLDPHNPPTRQAFEARQAESLRTFHVVPKNKLNTTAFVPSYADDIDEDDVAVQDAAVDMEIELASIRIDAGQALDEEQVHAMDDLHFDRATSRMWCERLMEPVHP
jgi:hypothetical protein